MDLQASSIFDVSDKVVVITGGGTGLGRYMAEGFAANRARVIIVGRREAVLRQTCAEIDAEIALGEAERGRSGAPARAGDGGEREGEGEDAGGVGGVGGREKVRWIRGDVSTKEGCAGVRDQLEGMVDRIDVLINNAGAQRPWRLSIMDNNDADEVEKLVWDGVDDEDWEITNATNVSGPYFLTSALVPLLRKADDPSVIMISSIAAIGNQRPVSTLTYGVSKAAMNKLASMLAGRLSPLGIRVNTICPGTFPSEITATWVPRPDVGDERIDQTGKGEWKLKSTAEAVTKRTPIPRAGMRHEIVGPALLLASRAGGFMTNAVISVDGGRTMTAGINDGIRMPEDSFYP